MLINYLEGSSTGDEWQELCDSCFRMRYQDAHYTTVPANYLGDGGIEGFTNNGIVFQCYCPQGINSNDLLYEKLRDKLTEDVGKLLKSEYKDKLLAIGVRQIKEWHFVIPEYRDNRILSHATNKQREIRELINTMTDADGYLDPSFEIIIKIAEDYAFEIMRIIRGNYNDIKLDLGSISDCCTDWSKCDSEKVRNVTRKVKAILGNDKQYKDEDTQAIIDTFMQHYIYGECKLKMLQNNNSVLYDELLKLEQAYKNKVKIESRLQQDHSLSNTYLRDTLKDFEKALEKFNFTEDSKISLAMALVSSWLADCSMEFRSKV